MHASKPSSQPSSIKDSHAESSSVSSPPWEHSPPTSSSNLPGTPETIDNNITQTPRKGPKGVRWEDSEFQQINRGYLGEVRKSSTFLFNLNWDLLFWKSESKNMHVFGVNGKNGEKSVVMISMVRRLKYVTLAELRYKGWGVCVIPSQNGRSLLENYLREYGRIRNWKGFPKEEDKKDHLSITATKVRVETEQLALMEEADDPDLERLQNIMSRMMAELLPTT